MGGGMCNRCAHCTGADGKLQFDNLCGSKSWYRLLCSVSGWLHLVPASLNMNIESNNSLFTMYRREGLRGKARTLKLRATSVIIGVALFQMKSLIVSHCALYLRSRI